MTRLRVPYLLAGLLIAVGIALLLGAAGASCEVSAALAALSLSDALLGVLGLVVSGLTAVAGVLLVVDVRADIAAARAWQSINAEMTVIGTSAEAAPVIRIDARYTAGPQDEGLRKILLAHRFVGPVPSRTEGIPLAPDRANAVAVDRCDDTRTGTTLPTTDLLSAANSFDPRRASRSYAAIKSVPRLVSTNAQVTGGRGQHCATRGESQTRLVANAGRWWTWASSTAAESRLAPVGSLADEVMVLAHRNGCDGDLARRNDAPEPVTTAQPGCRGPPAGASERQVRSGTMPVGKSFREKDRPRADAPADLVVTDNLGDRVPIGAAELDVVETYLDDVLRDLLAAVGAGRDGEPS